MKDETKSNDLAQLIIKKPLVHERRNIQSKVSTIKNKEMINRMKQETFSLILAQEQERAKFTHKRKK